MKKNELGHIIKKKVANTTPAIPPAMDWNRLDSANSILTPKGKGLSLTAKVILITTGTVVILTGAILFELNSKKETAEPVRLEEIEKIQIVEPTPKAPVLERIHSTTPLQVAPTTEPQFIKKNSNVITKKRNKKDTFESKEKTINTSQTPDARKESKTTTIYEVDTVTTETYIYE